jgi:hypothetical protein
MVKNRVLHNLLGFLKIQLLLSAIITPGSAHIILFFSCLTSSLAIITSIIRLFEMGRSLSLCFTTYLLNEVLHLHNLFQSFFKIKHFT